MATAKFKNAQGQWEELSVAKLETPRNINGVPFDGTQDITIPTGSSDYQGLSNKPQINGIELDGNKTSADLGLEPAKCADDFYVTNAEKTQGALATGNANLDTVKKVADKADRLLVDFTVPTDTSSITFDRDKNGVLFNILDIKGITIYSNFLNTSSTFHKLRVNDISSGYNSSFVNNDAALFACGNIASVNKCDLQIISGKLYYYTQYVGFSTLNPPANSPNPSFLYGYNTNIIENISVINIITFCKAGSTIKIYRND